MNLLVVGGVANRKAGALEWSSFKNGRICEIDFASKKLLRDFNYNSNIENRPKATSSDLFKSISKVGDDRYLIPTKTEVTVFNSAKWIIEKSFSNKYFNDVHHAIIKDDDAYVVSTGTDSIVICNPIDGSVKQVLPVIDENKDRLQELIIKYEDLRKIESLKPHYSHPNFCFEYNKNIYVTRFKQKDVMNIANRKVYPIADNFIHDGIVQKDTLFFTSVEGGVHVTQLDGNVSHFDLRAGRKDNLGLGWCRGILPVEKNHVYVGFSVFRNTAYKENLKWLASKVIRNTSHSNLPTRIELHDLLHGKLLDTLDVSEFGLDAIFSICVSDRKNTV